MTYHSDRDQKQKNGLKYGIFFIVFSCIVIFWFRFKGATYPLIEPVVEVYVSVKKNIGMIPEFFEVYTTSRSALVTKVKNLEVVIETLENKIAEQNAKLTDLNVKASSFDEVSSGVVLSMYPLMSDITKIYSTILLSKGYKDGVEKDAYVYVRGLQPVCIIREVYASTALCELLSSSGIMTDAVVVGETSSSTVVLSLVGRGGGTFLANVARDTPIKIGDKVVLKSDQSMTIGTVVEVLNNNQDTSWRVFVKGAYNPVTSSIFYIHKN